MMKKTSEFDANGVGGEFYRERLLDLFGNIAHTEVTNGSLSFIPGYNEIITSAFDPIAELYQSGGVKIFNAKTGADSRGYIIYRLASGAFGKASGLGRDEPLYNRHRLSWQPVMVRR